MMATTMATLRRVRGARVLTVALSFASRSFAISLGQPSRVCITTQEENLQGIAHVLANELGLAYFSLSDGDADDAFSHVIDVIPHEIEKESTYAVGIRALENTSKTKKRRQRRRLSFGSGSPTPYIVDFAPTSKSRAAQRAKRSSERTELLVKAVAPSKIEGGAVVYDLTAGFAQDTQLLLAQASQVCMVERDPIVACLLQDALRRLHLCRSHGVDVTNVSDKLSLRVDSATNVLDTIAMATEARPHVCYLDPMFPPRTKSAAVKKNMQILHGLLASQQVDDSILREEEGVLEAALSVAQSRVVVKRPINAPALGGAAYDGRKPSFELRGSINRFDVYLC